ncbi:RluA family pseudouridine synthase [Butyrivibrio sp. MC2013]|uniref:RluA family pseudouridine synthase n=1 Tax=Butyrivibrio sp. MC2013 TaxID=1280686 RepID=UPI0003F892C8|nr:RluA family pseudouridine synthase [Butyrivibrio sp. MC2013]
MKILYEDDDILVVHKEAGLATESANIREEDLVSRLRTYIIRKNRKERTEQPFVGLVHRLDQPVEGLLVVARNSRAAAALSRDLKDKSTSDSFNKRYYALVKGEPDKSIPHIDSKELDNGYVYIEDMICRLPEGKALVLPPLGDYPKDAKKASLEYKLIKKGENGSLMDVHLLTGRFHQIRAEMSYMGCPITGDVKYGGEPLPRRSGIALCAYSLTFRHPVSGRELSFDIVPEGQLFKSSGYFV